MTSPSTPPREAQRVETVIELLRESYGLTPTTVSGLLVGHCTTNYRAICAEGTFFVKQYQADADIAAERTAIAQSEHAGTQRVPVARPVTSRDGDLIAEHDPIAVSVWSWVEGEMFPKGLNHSQQQAAGTALGRIHRAFAGHSDGGRQTIDLATWLHLPRVISDLDALLDLVSARGHLDAFDHEAERDLRERRASLERVPALVAELPALGSQVLHGDYSSVNLLFRGDELAAVVDFAPPEPFLTGYELGRIAFDPGLVACADDWLSRGLSLVEAYLSEGPPTTANDVRCCARLWLLRLLTTLYGVREHYVDPQPHQADLDRFWRWRHHTSTVLLAQLNDVEAALSELVADRWKEHGIDRD